MSIFAHYQIDISFKDYLNVEQKAILSQTNKYYNNLLKKELFPYCDFYMKLKSKYKDPKYNTKILDKNEDIFSKSIYYNNYNVMIYIYNKYKPIFCLGNITIYFFRIGYLKKSSQIIDFLHTIIPSNGLLYEYIHNFSLNGLKKIINIISDTKIYEIFTNAVINKNYNVIKFICDTYKFNFNDINKIYDIRTFKIYLKCSNNMRKYYPLLSACESGNIYFLRYLLSIENNKRTLYKTLDIIHNNQKYYYLNFDGILQCILEVCKPVHTQYIMCKALKTKNHNLVKWLLINRYIEPSSDLLEYAYYYGDRYLISKFSKRVITNDIGRYLYQALNGGNFDIYMEERYKLKNNCPNTFDIINDAICDNNLDKIKIMLKFFSYNMNEIHHFFSTAILHGRFLIARYLYAILPIDIFFNDHFAYNNALKNMSCSIQEKIQMADWICSFGNNYGYNIVCGEIVCL